MEIGRGRFSHMRVPVLKKDRGATKDSCLPRLGRLGDGNLYCLDCVNVE